MTGSRLTRRAWTLAVGSIASLRAQQPPAAASDSERARQRVQTQTQALRKVALPRDIEPAFKFQA